MNIKGIILANLHSDIVNIETWAITTHKFYNHPDIVARIKCSNRILYNGMMIGFDIILFLQNDCEIVFNRISLPSDARV